MSINYFDDQKQSLKPSHELDNIIFEMIPRSHIVSIEMNILNKREAQFVYLKTRRAFGREMWSKEDGVYYLPELKGVIVHKDNNFTKYATREEALEVAIELRDKMKHYVNKMADLVRDNLKRHDAIMKTTAKPTKAQTRRSYSAVTLLSPKLIAEIEERASTLNMTELAKMELTVKTYLRSQGIRFPKSTKKEKE
jgi:hypothetical protein